MALRLTSNNVYHSISVAFVSRYGVINYKFCGVAGMLTNGYNMLNVNPQNPKGYK